MNTSLLITIIFLLAVALLVVWHWYRHYHLYNEDKLRRSVEAIYKEIGTRGMSKPQFVRMLRHHYRCTHKEAVYLLGKALSNKWVLLEDNRVYKV